MEKFVISVSTSLSLFGQAVTGTISGNVADPSGGVLSNATVRAINADTSETRNTVTDAQGSYLFPTPVPGQAKTPVSTNLATPSFPPARFSAGQNSNRAPNCRLRGM